MMLSAFINLLRIQNDPLPKISSYLDYTPIGTVVAAVIFIVTYFMVRRVSKKYAGRDTN
jgi:phosphotransferase system  glucose/maltose/N-acetylglucosamine-specific IIC component